MYRARLAALTLEVRRFGLSETFGIEDLIRRRKQLEVAQVKRQLRAHSVEAVTNTPIDLLANAIVNADRAVALQQPVVMVDRIELSPWDIDELRPAQAVDTAGIRLPLLVAEVDIKKCFARIFKVQRIPGDWPGELNDLFVAECHWNSRPMTAAIFLKGKSVPRPLDIAHLGKGGDQVVRLATSPADIFVVQHIDEITQPVRIHLYNEVELARSRGRAAHACFIDGKQTAAILERFYET